MDVWGAIKAGLKKAWGWVVAAWEATIAFLGPDARAIAGQINKMELVKALTLAVTSGTFTGFLQALAASTGLWIVDANAAGVVSGLLTAAVFVLDWLRRRGHQSPTMPRPRP